MSKSRGAENGGCREGETRARGCCRCYLALPRCPRGLETWGQVGRKGVTLLFGSR